MISLRQRDGEAEVERILQHILQLPQFCEEPRLAQGWALLHIQSKQIIIPGWTQEKKRYLFNSELHKLGSHQPFYRGELGYAVRFLMGYFFVTQVGTTPSEAVDPKNNQPHIVVVTDDIGEDMQYLIAVEQNLTLKTDNLVSAVYLLIATHYVFNMDYHTKAKYFLTFIASKVAGISVSGYKWGTIVATHVSGLCQLYEERKKTTMSYMDDSQ